MNATHILMDADWGDLAYAIAVLVFGLVGAIANKLKKKAEGGETSSPSPEDATLEEVLRPVREAMMRKKQEQQRPEQSRPAPPSQQTPAPQRRPKPVVRRPSPSPAAAPQSQRRPAARQVAVPVPTGRPRKEPPPRPAAPPPEVSAVPEPPADLIAPPHTATAPAAQQAPSPLAYLQAPAALRRAIIAAELFGKPVSLRDDHHF